jgi:hypothetical protein
MMHNYNVETFDIAKIKSKIEIFIALLKIILDYVKDMNKKDKVTSLMDID